MKPTLKFSPPLQADIDIANWRRAQSCAARVGFWLAIGCVACSYLYGALVGGA